MGEKELIVATAKEIFIAISSARSVFSLFSICIPIPMSPRVCKRHHLTRFDPAFNGLSVPEFNHQPAGKPIPPQLAKPPDHKR